MSPMNNRLLVPRKTPGLLDLVPGAAAAYALRSLSNSYADPVVTVRRSSDDAEDSFTAAEVSDGTLAAFCGAGDGFVKQWWDQSGNARHAVAAADANEPQIVDSGVVITEEGKPSVLFDGSDDVLKTGSFSTTPAVSAFIVCQTNAWTTPSSYGAPLSHAYSGGATTGVGFAYVTSASLAGWIAGDLLSFGSGYSSLTPRANGPMASGSDARLISVCMSTENATAHINGSLVSTRISSVGAVAAVSGPVSVGAGSSSELWEGTISEAIYYPSDQTANRELLEGQIAWSYSV